MCSEDKINLDDCHNNDAIWGLAVKTSFELIDNRVRHKDHVLHCLIRIGINDWTGFDVRGLEGIRCPACVFATTQASDNPPTQHPIFLTRVTLPSWICTCPNLSWHSTTVATSLPPWLPLQPSADLSTCLFPCLTWFSVPFWPPG